MPPILPERATPGEIGYGRRQPCSVSAGKLKVREITHGSDNTYETDNLTALLEEGKIDSSYIPKQIYLFDLKLCSEKQGHVIVEEHHWNQTSGHARSVYLGGGKETKATRLCREK